MSDIFAPLLPLLGSFGPLFAIALLIGVVGAISRMPTVRGRLGEWAVRRRLERSLPAEEYTCRHDATLPCADGTTQVDHVVFSRFGIFVVETKNMSGWIFGSERDAQWTQKIYRHSTRFQNPLRQNHRHVLTLAETLHVDVSVFISAVVFVGNAEFRTPMPPSVTSARGLVGFIRSHDRDVLARKVVDLAVAAFDRSVLAPGRETDRRHVSNVSARVAARRDPSKCPKCAGPLQERSNRHTGDVFLGCARYPACRGTRPHGGR